MYSSPDTWSRIQRPNMQELQKLHYEMQLWMSHTRYQLHEVDRIPLWRVQNTSVTLATGLSFGCYFLFKRIRPGLTFPVDIIPPFLTFYATHRIAQVSQMGALWDSFLSLPSPLGDTARGLLAAVRANSKLPSDTFRRAAPAPEGAAGSLPVPKPEAGNAFFPEAAQPGPKDDPWGTGGSSAWDGDASDTKSSQRGTSWDEIRARSAQR